jgi:TonB-linked SusC/RagA family outer membrane protein
MTKKVPKSINSTRRIILGLILLFTCSLGLQAQQTIKGKVTSTDAGALPGVSVRIENSASGTVTDIDGNFSIKVPNKQTVLLFSYIGYVNSKIIVGDQTTINVNLMPDLTSLDEVVVIGYGTQKKSDLTGSIASVSAKDIEERSPVSIFDAIQGAAAGVQITSNSGAPGSDTDVRIRGTSTFEGGVTPLYIVDGVSQSDISMINPTDIQSIEILKDAASAAIYGSRSANGVILITTKSGVEGKPKINISYLHSISQLSNKISQANKFYKKIFSSKTSTVSAAEATDSLYIGTNASNDYLSMVTQPGIRDQVDFSASGGTKGSNYYASLGYLNETGIVIESYNKRLTGRLNIEFNPTSKLKFTSRVSFTYGKKNNISEGRVIAGSIIRPPDFILFYPDGSYAYNIAGVRNPLAEARFAKSITASYNGTLYQSGEYTFNKNLRFQTSVTADISYSDNSSFSSKVLSTSSPAIGSASDQTSFDKHFLSESFFSFNKTFGLDHSVTAMIGNSVETYRSDDVNVGGSRLVTESVQTLNSVQDIDKGGTNTAATEHAMISYFGRAGYSYKGRYLANLTVRRDGSSRFTSQPWGTFPSASVAWRISDEKFLNWAKKTALLDDAKIRASWGETGNERVGDYDSYNQYILGGDYTYFGYGAVLPSTTIGNPDLSWERTTQKNLGLDLSMFKGRLNAVVDYYDKTTDHLLYSSQVPSELGYSTMKINLGKIQNKGIEVTITGFPVRNKIFSWQTSVNVSRNNNKIIELAKADYVASSKWYVGKGRPVGQWYGFKWLGIYQYDASNAYTSDYKTRLNPVFQKDSYGNDVIDKSGIPALIGYKLPNGADYGWNNDPSSPSYKPVYQMYAQGNVSKGGDVIWQNLPDAQGNYNNLIDDNDRQVLGDAVAKWYGAWSNTFTYKNLSLYVSFYTSWGNLVYNKQRRDLVTYSSSNATPWPYDILNAWKYQGQITDVAIASKGTTDNSRELSSYFLEDGSFVRLRNVRLSYKLDNTIAQKLHMSMMTFYVYGNNLLTWTNYKGFDPELGGSVLTPGEDSGRYPRKTEVGFGLNMNF